MPTATYPLPVLFLILDPDAKSSLLFKRVVKGTGVDPILCARQAPNGNAYAEDSFSRSSPSVSAG
jgi:hypothetical protein